MIGLVVTIICIIISVFCYKKIANSCRNKGRGNVRTFLTALISSSVLFMLTMSIGVASFSPSNEGGKISENTVQVKNTTHNRSNEKNKNVYICNKFDAITQTRQGTKNNSGFYSDTATRITYTITDSVLTTKLSSSEIESSTETATFNNIADDGSRKYGNSSSNFFVYVLNDSTIKVIMIDFNANMTLTQICSN
ncbi:hypothetical protein ACEW7I_002548 [Yersinia enterocolitica]|uniref:hypothetical protein n=1 Tax=Yersinia enterocolitica TaxID=630 RepID=UPI00330076D4|nr:hypothetical protein [Yersinia enterocolitica]HDL7229011.1 hypothetical protein [Yersinia enterocolitica]HDL8118274.1 hypothetical protein [Yersinia enterocolitica]HDL8139507.1 hypothetical protein [Yersinia enterocolitica]HDL8295265.1 hypothetical protein [Yersinia enterocolitica]